MLDIISALIPIFSLILIGYFFKKIKFPSYEFWPLADKLTYFILMPSLLIYKLASASKNSVVPFEFILSPLLTIFCIFVILIVLNKFLKFKGEAFTSIMQGGIRFNTYIFLAITNVLFGEEGLLLSAIILPFVIIFINLLCIATFSLYTPKSKLNMTYLIKSIVTNPLIVACFIGSLIHFSSFTIPNTVLNIFSIIGNAALPMGLLSIGFALVVKEIKTTKSAIFISSVAKFVLFPVLIIIFANIFGLDEQSKAILLIFALVPTASSAFILARQLGGDVGLMSSIISLQTLFSILFLSFVLTQIM